MSFNRVAFNTIILLLFLVGCKEEKTIKVPQEPQIKLAQDSIDAIEITSEEKEVEEFRLNEENSIEFFFDYQKDLKDNKVKLTTSMGSFIVQLYDNVPYHKANFIFLTRQGYFDGTQFHRIVENFIIQGGNSDDDETAKKRGKLGRYLLPPDSKKGYKHHRGTLSMPSSEINNPHKLASPYEFFIVVTKPGSYHLDGDFTPFGKVIQGMHVVDKINKVEVGKGDWPQNNVYIEKAEVIQ
ncbi:peptidylprolyl isomerase [Maribacter algarum]|uniref:Peptidyl-prolyl cis-trans isomerase n=1 Tax=Maribacter algarum (ex Zhang et al. 2020) TaxID=2578118 RepID=A0A5S3PN77_9FLAO|nr:peptidylprolyl isomerase [Maribacter algarum]TMM55928.1 peptidylprolyl isomerase [Maribacter algarum]